MVYYTPVNTNYLSGLFGIFMFVTQAQDELEDRKE
jgi:hypothetical protein